MVAKLEAWSAPISPSKALQRFLYAFVPQIVRTRFFGESPIAVELHETSWLNGLRGLAALFVFQHHFLNPYTDMGLVSYDDTHKYWIQLPIVRAFYCGAAQVSMFFVVGGYVLALKPLMLMREDNAANHAKLFGVLFSSAFRRFFRLFLPVFASTNIVLWATHLGLFDFVNSILDDRNIFPRFSFRIVPKFPTLWEQYHFWFLDMRGLTNFAVERPYDPVHDLALWTLPYEFRAGMTLLLILVAVARIQRYLRLASLMALSVYYLYMDRWPVTYFLWGACIAQLDVHRTDASYKRIPTTSNPAIELEMQQIDQVQSYASYSRALSHTSYRSLVNSMKAFMLLLAVFIYSAPEANFYVAYGYRTIASYWPQSMLVRHFIALGTVLMLLVLRTCDEDFAVKRLCNSSIVQYLGRISFSLYLLHGPVLRVIGVYIPIYVWKFMPREQTWSYTIGLLIGWFVNLIIISWASDIFSREVDVRVVNFTRWLELKCRV